MKTNQVKLGKLFNSVQSKLSLNNLQWLICRKTQANQITKQMLQLPTPIVFKNPKTNA